MSGPNLPDYDICVTTTAAPETTTAEETSVVPETTTAMETTPEPTVTAEQTTSGRVWRKQKILFCREGNSEGKIQESESSKFQKM